MTTMGYRVAAVINVSARSLFARVTKFVPGDAGNPRENRLTEIFAAVLERVPTLAGALAELWLDPEQARAPEPELAASAASAAWERVREATHDCVPVVSTQVMVAGGFVDLEMRFPGNTRARVDDVVVWVEIKHGTEPDRKQLLTYLRALTESHTSLGGVGAVVLLDRRHKLPYTDELEVPPAVAQRSWENTARAIHRFRRLAGADVVSDWLCEELLSYLQEENLMDPIVLGPEHLTALAYAGEANKALEAICQRAEGQIANSFRQPDATGPRTGQYGEDYYASWGDGIWLEWHLLRKAGHGPLEIRAGLCTYKRAQFEPEVERQLVQGISISGKVVVFDRWQGPKERLMRVARPQDVLVGGDVDAQAESLANWVCDTLHAVETIVAMQG